MLELLQALRVVGLYAAELVPLTMEGGIGDLEVSTDLFDGLSPG
jgi:hypothetical protein